MKTKLLLAIVVAGLTGVNAYAKPAAENNGQSIVTDPSPECRRNCETSYNACKSAVPVRKLKRVCNALRAGCLAGCFGEDIWDDLFPASGSLNDITLDGISNLEVN